MLECLSLLLFGSTSHAGIVVGRSNPDVGVQTSDADA